jgi:hypothetical protein
MEKKKKGTPNRPADDGNTGTYRFDKELGKVVKVSDKVPGLSKGGADFSGADAPSSPCSSCPSGGACGMGGGGFGGDF